MGLRKNLRENENPRDEWRDERVTEPLVEGRYYMWDASNRPRQTIVKCIGRGADFSIVRVVADGDVEAIQDSRMEYLGFYRIGRVTARNKLIPFLEKELAVVRYTILRAEEALEALERIEHA